MLKVSSLSASTSMMMLSEILWKGYLSKLQPSLKNAYSLQEKYMTQLENL